jgi:hypothetical protein
MYYTQRQWDRIVGFGTVPDQYKKKGFKVTIVYAFNSDYIPEGVSTLDDMKKFIDENAFPEDCIRHESKGYTYTLEVEEIDV